MSRFIKPEVLQNFKESEQSFKTFDVFLFNQRDDSKLFVGMSFKEKLKKLIRDGDIDNAERDVFFDAVRFFYVTAFTYCQQWLPLDNALLKYFGFINFEERLQHNFDNHLNATHVFGEFIDNTKVMDKLEEEFILYHGMASSEIPQNVWDSAIVQETSDDETVVYHRMDTIWHI